VAIAVAVVIAIMATAIVVVVAMIVTPIVVMVVSVVADYATRQRHGARDQQARRHNMQ
jgi:hypothetical protein